MLLKSGAPGKIKDSNPLLFSLYKIVGSKSLISKIPSPTALIKI